ncbi:MAG: hypothetical protein AB1393_11415 [Candidatus Edwardsbacteria bacterium]
MEDTNLVKALLVICALLNTKEALSQESYYDRLNRIKKNSDSLRISVPDTNKPSKCFWLDLGTGLISESKEGFVIDINLNYAAKNHILSGQFVNADDFRIFGGGKVSYDFSFLYGRYYSKERIFASIATGLSYVKGWASICAATDSGDEFNGFDFSLGGSIKRHFSTIGIPVRAQVMIRWKYLGIGLSGIVNMNSERPYQGLLLNISPGKLK